MPRFKVDLIAAVALGGSVIVDAVSPAAARDIALGQSKHVKWEPTATVKPDDCYVAGVERLADGPAEAADKAA